MELLDVLDENGKITGKVEERKVIHKKGLWHFHVAIWIMNKNGEVLFQKRSKNKKKNPGMWARTGGHVNAGETPLEGIIRETKEEVGILIPKEKLELIKVEKFEKKCENGLIQRNFLYNYIAIVDYPIEKYVLQKEEVEEVKYMDISEIEEKNKIKDSNYTFSNWSEENFKEHINDLKKWREKL